MTATTGADGAGGWDAVRIGWVVESGGRDRHDWVGLAIPIRRLCDSRDLRSAASERQEFRDRRRGGNLQIRSTKSETDSKQERAKAGSTDGADSRGLRKARTAESKNQRFFTTEDAENTEKGKRVFDSPDESGLRYAQD